MGLDKTYIFNNPTTALCFQLSRYKKDLLLYSYNERPNWLYCVAHLHSSHADEVESTTFKSQSSIETRYFLKTNFYHIPADKKIKSMVIKLRTRIAI